MKRIIAIVALVLAGVLAFSACSTISTDSDEVGLHYKAGAFSSTKFANCVPPNTRNFDGPGDKHYIYPSGQRTYSFTGAEGSEAKPIPVTTNEGQEVDVPGFVTFSLNTDCATLRKFHEQLGLKDGAFKGGGPNGNGWLDFLNTYIYTPLNSAMNKAAQDIKPATAANGSVTEASWQRLYASTAVQQQFAADVKSDLPGQVTAALGGDYIKIIDVQISKPTVPDDLKAAIQAKQVAQQDNAAQKAKNAKVLTQYETIKDCLKTGLDKSDCTLIFLNQSGADIPFLPVPQGGAINFAPGATPAN